MSDGDMAAQGAGDDAIVPQSCDAAAPPLSEVRVSTVMSQLGGREAIAPGQTATRRQHGGSFVSVIVEEVGYGSEPLARVNGSLLDRSALEQRDGFCIDADGRIVSPCQAGMTIAGWYLHWDLTRWLALPGGGPCAFGFQDTSTNAPWNTLSTRLQIL